MTQAQILVTCLAVLAIVFCLFRIAKNRPRAARPLDLLKTAQVMLDLETLGTAPGCKILSIGACVFTQYGVTEPLFFYREIKRHTGQDMLAEDPDTVIWWSEQSAEAKRGLLTDRDDDGKVTLTLALIEFHRWLQEVGGVDSRGNVLVDVWGNGSDFDNIIIRAAAKAVNVKPGWPYWGNRDYRTLKGLLPHIKAERLGTHHNALDDARTQAVHASILLKELRLWGR